MTQHLSYSQLHSWTVCGEQTRLERVVKVPRTPAWALIGGNAIHTATEEHDFRLLGVDVPVRPFGAILDEYASKAEEESGLPRSEFRASGRATKANPDKENEAWWLTEGPAMLKRWENFRRLTPWEIWTTPAGEPAIELGFELELLGGEVVVRGFIDRVFTTSTPDSLIVFDLKSGSSKQATPRQLGTYKLGLEEAFGATGVDYGCFWDARSGSTSSVYGLGRFTRDRLEYQYGAMGHAKETGLYLPAPGPMCNSCGVRSFCYEVDGERADEVSKPWEPLHVFGESVDVPEEAA